jgi:hypothetical protein
MFPRGVVQSGGEKDSSVINGSRRGEKRSSELLIFSPSVSPKGSNTSFFFFEPDLLDLCFMVSLAEPLAEPDEANLFWAAHALEFGVAGSFAVKPATQNIVIDILLSSNNEQ